MSIECYAANVHPGDTVTGIWSVARHRYDTVHHAVTGVDEWTAPNGERVVTLHTGSQPWQQSTYSADTTVRVRLPARNPA